ncbi:MAG: nuclear transport factor 2 family protein [Pseudomonadota bacterium]
MTASLNPTDRLQIQELIARYAWSLDTGDIEGFISCFSSEGALVWNVFDPPGCWQGHAALQRFISYFVARPESAGRQHHVSNLVIASHPDGAVARSYVLVALRAGGGPHLVTVMGHYEDLLVRDGADWRFARREIRDWSGPVLSRFAGQDGERKPRELPEALNALWSTR